MGKTIGQFAYDIIKMDGREQIPFNPIVTIMLDHFCQSEISRMPTVSPHLMTESEIDDHIQALKDDLDVVGKKAKLALRKALEAAHSDKSN